MSQEIMAFVLLLVSLPMFAACDPSINLVVAVHSRPNPTRQL